MPRRTNFQGFFDKYGRQREAALARHLVKARYGPRLLLLEKLSDALGKLFGLYLEADVLVKQVRPSDPSNPPFVNALSNQPMQTEAVLLLCKSGLFGLTYPIQRQAFESLVIAKGTLYDGTLIKRWAMPEAERTPKHDIRLTGDVLDKWVPIVGNARLRKHWRELNELTHHTPFAHQPPRVLVKAASKADQKFLLQQYQEMLPATHKALDYWFAILLLNFELLNEYRREIPRGLFERSRPLANEERRLKGRAAHIVREYKAANGRVLSRMPAGLAREFGAEWHPQR